MDTDQSTYERLHCLISSLIKQIDITTSSSKIKLIVNTIYYRIVYGIDTSIADAWENTIKETRIIMSSYILHNGINPTLFNDDGVITLYNDIISEVNQSSHVVQETIKDDGYLPLLKAYIKYNASMGMDDISLHSKHLSVGEAMMLRKLKYE